MKRTKQKPPVYTNNVTINYYEPALGDRYWILERRVHCTETFLVRVDSRAEAQEVIDKDLFDRHDHRDFKETWVGKTRVVKQDKSEVLSVTWTCPSCGYVYGEKYNLKRKFCDNCAWCIHPDSAIAIVNGEGICSWCGVKVEKKKGANDGKRN